MGSSDRPDMEVLDTEPAPSALRVWTEAQLARRGVRSGLAVTAALLIGVALAVVPGERREPALSSDGTAPARADQHPESPTDRAPSTGPWRVADDLAVFSGPRGHVVTFSAWNGGPAPEDPAGLEVTGGFVDRDDLEYTARCDGVDLDARGGPRFHGLVVPGYKVFVRCRDVTRYAGEVAWIDLNSITVREVS